jgi:hypothetical protein
MSIKAKEVKDAIIENYGEGNGPYFMIANPKDYQNYFQTIATNPYARLINDKIRDKNIAGVMTAVSSARETFGEDEVSIYLDNNYDLGFVGIGISKGGSLINAKVIAL